MEEDERKFYSRTTRDVTEQLCPVCYNRAKSFQWVISGFFVVIAVSLAVAVILL
jgi:RNA polymerase subunit RPABC4/transcription elongation factor Spt4